MQNKKQLLVGGFLLIAYAVNYIEKSGDMKSNLNDDDNDSISQFSNESVGNTNSANKSVLLTVPASIRQLRKPMLSFKIININGLSKIQIGDESRGI